MYVVTILPPRRGKQPLTPSLSWFNYFSLRSVQSTCTLFLAKNARSTSVWHSSVTPLSYIHEAHWNGHHLYVREVCHTWCAPSTYNPFRYTKRSGETGSFKITIYFCNFIPIFSRFGLTLEVLWIRAKKMLIMVWRPRWSSISRSAPIMHTKGGYEWREVWNAHHQLQIHHVPVPVVSTGHERKSLREAKTRTKEITSIMGLLR